MSAISTPAYERATVRRDGGGRILSRSLCLGIGRQGIVDVMPRLKHHLV